MAYGICFFFRLNETYKIYYYYVTLCTLYLHFTDVPELLLPSNKMFNWKISPHFITNVQIKGVCSFGMQI